jgi:protein dithiol:quinone oxidoreductase
MKPASKQRLQRVLPAAFAVGLLAFGLGLQLALGLIPCPMCILQRMAWLAIVGVSLTATLFVKLPLRLYAALLAILALAGAGVAARQSWLQWFPPESASCGRDFDGLIETFPLPKALSLMFRGSGDCSVVDWTFLGGSIANWSFVCFALVVVDAVVLWRQRGPR